VITKVYHEPLDFLAEAGWAVRASREGWGAPVVNVDPGSLSVTYERGVRVSRHTPAWVELLDLIGSLHAVGVHHRDVHLGNLLRFSGSLRLIDWETAIEVPGAASYDLDGPTEAVPLPVLHEGLPAMYLRATWHRRCLLRAWG
jgi:hypothetical protein